MLDSKSKKDINGGLQRLNRFSKLNLMHRVLLLEQFKKQVLRRVLSYKATRWLKSKIVDKLAFNL